MTTAIATPPRVADLEAQLGARMAAAVAAEGWEPKMPPAEPVVRKGGRPETAAIKDRRAKVRRLYRKGLAKTEIAHRLGATYEQVKSDCTALRDRGLL